MLQTPTNTGNSDLANFSFNGSVNRVLGISRLLFGWETFERSIIHSKNIFSPQSRMIRGKRNTPTPQLIYSFDIGLPEVETTKGANESIIYYFVNPQKAKDISKNVNDLDEEQPRLFDKLNDYISLILYPEKLKDTNFNSLPKLRKYFNEEELKILNDFKLVENYKLKKKIFRIRPEVVGYFSYMNDWGKGFKFKGSASFRNLYQVLNASTETKVLNTRSPMPANMMRLDEVNSSKFKLFVKNTFIRLLQKNEYSQNEIKLIMKAYDLAEILQYERPRKNGTPYFLHPLRVASMAVQFMGFHGSKDANVVAAALLHDTVEDNKDTLVALLQQKLNVAQRSPEVYKLLGRYLNPEIASLIEEVTIPKCKDRTKDEKEQEAENSLLKKEFYRKFKDASQGAKVIKLCDRTDNTITLYATDMVSCMKKLRESLEMIIPAIFPEKSFESHRKLGICEPLNNVLVDLHNLLIKNLRFVYLACEDITHYKIRGNSTSFVDAYKEISSGDNPEIIHDLELFDLLISRDYIRSYIRSYD